MSAPDFYFAVNAMFRYLHDTYGKAALVEYWRSLAREYYGPRIAQWKTGGLIGVADDWKRYFAAEPQADVVVHRRQHEVELEIRVCPAIRHLRDQDREILPCFCEHCDHTCGVMAEEAGLDFQRSGGMGSCRQRFSSRLPQGDAMARVMNQAAQGHAS